MVMMRSSSPGFTGAGTSRVVGRGNLESSIALQRDGLQNVGRVLCLVGRGFEHFVQLLDLNEMDRVLLIVEQVRDGLSAQAISFVSSRWTSTQCSRTSLFFSSRET